MHIGIDMCVCLCAYACAQLMIGKRCFSTGGSGNDDGGWFVVVIIWTFLVQRHLLLRYRPSVSKVVGVVGRRILVVGFRWG